MRQFKILSFAGCCLIVAAALLAASPAQAQSKRDIDRCEDNDGRLSAAERIPACTALIRSGRYKGKDLAWVLNNRGADYNATDDYDRAIADFNEALRHDSKYTSAYYNRGNAYRDKKEYDRALVDYTTAITSSVPSSVSTDSGTKTGNRIRADYFSARGRVHQLKGDNGLAIADLKEAVRLDPGHKLARDRLKELGATP